MATPRTLLGRFQKGPKRKFQGKLLQSFFGDQHTIPVDLVASGDIKTLIRDLKAMGIEVTASAGRTVSALIPREKLGALEKVESLKSARPAVTNKTPFNPPKSGVPIRPFAPVPKPTTSPKKLLSRPIRFPTNLQRKSGQTRGGQISKADRLNIVKSALRLRLTPAAARDFTRTTGRKLPTLTQAKKVMGRARRGVGLIAPPVRDTRPPSRQFTSGGLRRRRGL